MHGRHTRSVVRSLATKPRLRVSSRVSSLRPNRRCGASAVEVSFVMPVFLTFMFGIIQYGHVQMVSNLLTNACRKAARVGSTEGITNLEAEAIVRKTMSAALDDNRLVILIKDAAIFDGPSSGLPSSTADYDGLPDIELSEATSRQLFVIHVSVEYDDVALLSLPYTSGIELEGHAVMRHE